VRVSDDLMGEEAPGRQSNVVCVARDSPNSAMLLIATAAKQDCLSHEHTASIASLICADDRVDI